MPNFVPRHTISHTRKSRLFFSALTAAALPLLSGCGRSNPETTVPDIKTPAAPAAAASDFKVALITPGPVSDNGWNAQAYKALQEVKTATGADVQNVEAKTSGEQEENLRAYASKKFNVVIAHGAEMEKMALDMEKDFPSTLFVVDSGRIVGAHTTPLVLRMEDSAYLMGMLAASMSKTGKIGSVGAQNSAAIEAVFKAFAAGAKAAKPGITVIPPTYTNDWDDVAKGKAQALALIDQGADVLIDDLDGAAPGVFDAAKSRNTPDKPVYVLATNNDQNASAPDVILASAPVLLNKAYVAIAQGVKAGTFKPNDTGYGLKSGAIGFILNPALQAKIPAAVKAKLDDAQKKITNGTLDTTKG